MRASSETSSLSDNELRKTISNTSSIDILNSSEEKTMEPPTKNESRDSVLTALSREASRLLRESYNIEIGAYRIKSSTPQENKKITDAITKNLDPTDNKNIAANRINGLLKDIEKINEQKNITIDELINILKETEKVSNQHRESNPAAFFKFSTTGTKQIKNIIDGLVETKKNSPKI